jgi:aspartate aminotransferase
VHPPILRWAPARLGKVCLARSYRAAMTGWRIGFGTGPLADRCDGETAGPANVGHLLHLAARGIGGLVGPAGLHRVEPRRYRTPPRSSGSRFEPDSGPECALPGGAFYTFPSCAGLIGRTTTAGQQPTSDEDVAGALLDEAGVALDHGSAFGVGSCRPRLASLTQPLRLEPCPLADGLSGALHEQLCRAAHMLADSTVGG